MPSEDALGPYLREVNRIRATGRATEHSYRGTFQAFVEAQRQGVNVLNEPRRVVDLGAPDYDVRSGQGLLGRIEVKDLHVPLGRIEEDSNRAAPTTDEGRQLKRYRARIDNLIFSDYNEIRWYRNGQRTGPPVRLAAVGTAGELVPEPAGAAAALAVLRDFLAVEPVTATSAEELAQRMASLALLVRHIIEESFRQGVASQDLRDLKAQVDQNLLAGQSDDDFADMVAQTLAYGLFAARVHQHGSGQGEFDRTRAAALVPRTNPFLRSLFHLLFNGLDFDQQPYAGFANDLVEVLGRADMEQVLRGFTDRATPEHPVVHFYETFLGKYNPQERERRGVYYTPTQVVSYIVRSVDALLRDPNGLGVRDGLATDSSRDGGPKVLVLDPACGTGTFLEHVIARVREDFVRDAGLWPGYVQDHLLPRLFGFERLMAPYAIAHLHLSTVLAGHDLDDAARRSLGVDLDAMTAPDGSPARLGVYLTNTLEEPVTSDQVLGASFVAREADQAARVKRELPIMVVVGNPPYRARSTNPSFRDQTYRDRNGVERTRRANTWIGDQVDAYKRLVVTDPSGAEMTVGLGERNAQSLHDDYVKFMRFAEWRIEQTGQGVLGFVTNHGYLDNPTFRGMRQHLLRTFTDLYVLDLGGNPIKNSGRDDPDENVFDIKDAGVAIALFVKRPGAQPGLGAVRHHSVRGTRAAKEQFLAAHDVTTTPWSPLAPDHPAYLLVPQNDDTRAEWQRHVSVMDLFGLNGPGIKTGRDALTMHLSADDAWDAAVAFASLPEAAARERWSLGEQSEESKGWKYRTARQDLRAALTRAGYDPDRPTPEGAAAARAALIVPVSYRPFDTRWTVWTGTTQGFIAWPSTDAMRHYLDGPNVGLVTARQNASGTADHFWVTRHPTEMKTAESTRGSLTLPLYRYPQAASAADAQLDLTAPDDPAPGRTTALEPRTADLIADATGLAYHDDGHDDLRTGFGPRRRPRVRLRRPQRPGLPHPVRPAAPSGAPPRPAAAGRRPVRRPRPPRPPARRAPHRRPGHPPGRPCGQLSPARHRPGRKAHRDHQAAPMDPSRPPRPGRRTRRTRTALAPAPPPPRRRPRPHARAVRRRRQRSSLAVHRRRPPGVPQMAPSTGRPRARRPRPRAPAADRRGDHRDPRRQSADRAARRRPARAGRGRTAARTARGRIAPADPARHSRSRGTSACLGRMVRSRAGTRQGWTVRCCPTWTRPAATCLPAGTAAACRTSTAVSSARRTWKGPRPGPACGAG